MNSDYAKAFLFILLLDFMLFLTQMGIDSVAADVGRNLSIYDYDSGMIKGVDTGNYVLSTNYTSEIPTVTQSVSTDNNVLSYLTERWNSLRGWILQTPYLGAGYKIINALPRFLVFMGAPDYLWFSLSALWHLFVITLIVLLFVG